MILNSTEWSKLTTESVLALQRLVRLLTKVCPVSGGSQREGRLISNPLGLSGHDWCQSSSPVGGSLRLGRCYNEVECVATGGAIAGYCTPPLGGNILLRGVCCVHIVRSGQPSRAALSHLHSSQWPDKGNGSGLSQYTILPAPGVCFVRSASPSRTVHSILFYSSGWTCSPWSWRRPRGTVSTTGSPSSEGRT